MNCPNCQGTTTAKVSVVYKTGANTSYTEGKTVGVGIGLATSGAGIGVGVGSTEQNTRSISLLAAECAPPTVPPSLPGLIGIGLFLSMVIAMAGMFTGISWIPVAILCAGILATGYTVWLRYTEMLPNYDKRLSQWNSRWICMQCAHRWSPEDGG